MKRTLFLFFILFGLIIITVQNMNAKSYGLKKLKLNLDEQSIEIISPREGEILFASYTKTIYWASSEVNTINLSYSLDNGNNWNNIVTDYLASSGKYDWTVPDVSSSQCILKINAYDNNTIFSNVTFSITPAPVPVDIVFRGGFGDGYGMAANITNTNPQIQLVSPVGGENLYYGYTKTIYWASSEVNTINLSYSLDNGNNWNNIVTDYLASSGKYDWIIPNVSSNTVKIKITDSSNPLISALTTDPIRIYQTVTLNELAFRGGIGQGYAQGKLLGPDEEQILVLFNPQNNEKLYGGNSKKICWQSNNVDFINILFSSDNGNNWSSITYNQQASNGNYLWTVPDISSSQCILKISASDNNTIFSNITFSITPAPVPVDIVFRGGFGDGYGMAANITNNNPQIQFVSPVGGENLYYGYTKTIYWASSEVNTINLSYSLDNGNNWNNIVTDYLASSGKYDWTVPDISSGNVKIKITDSSNPLISALTIDPISIYQTVTLNELAFRGGFGQGYSTTSTDGAVPLPVELSLFCSTITKNNILLNWSTSYEQNLLGFEIERKEGDNKWIKIAFIDGNGNSNSVKEYSYSDNRLNSREYFYRLKMVDNDGAFKYSETIKAVVENPKEYSLSQNYPNPFNPATKIEYTLPQNDHVKLQIYSITGQLINSLVDEEQEAGYYVVDFLGNNLSSGIYIYRLSVKNKSFVKKMLLLK